MATYWHKHSRGFANECAIFRAATPDEAAWLEADGFTRITREEARRHLRWVNAENASWGSGRAIGNEDFSALVNPNHPDHRERYAASILIAEMQQYEAERAAELA